MKKTIAVLITVLLLSLGFVLGAVGCGGGEIQPTGVTLNYRSRTIAAGTTVQLKASIEPEEAVDKSVTWSSSDESIATVSDTGLVTGVAIGEATITVTTNSGGCTSQCKITVSPKEIESIEVTHQPDKTEYIEGEVFDSKGVVITGVFSDGSEDDVTAKCTFTPGVSLTTDDDKITVTYGGTDIETEIAVTVNEAVSATVGNDTELAEALKDDSINRIVVSEGAVLSSLSVDRNVIVDGTLDIVSMSVSKGVSLTVVGDVASSSNLTVSGEGNVIVSGNMRAVNNVEINGTLKLTVKGIIDDSIYDSENVYDIIYATSAIHAGQNITIQRATVDAFNNMFSNGTTTINSGATVSVYGISWCRNEEAYDHDHFGNGMQAVGGLTIEDAETTVRVMNNTNIENGKAALQSDGHILISEATVQLGKAENVTCYYSWGIWATNGYLTVTDGAQVDMTLRNEADLDPDSDVNAITTGMGSSANPAGTITFSAGESEVLTKVVIRAGRPIRDRVNFVGQEFMEFIPWI